ncbi:carbon monoxide dehydrogenase subunit G [Defluviimonas sp. WL0002]|uniref:Carbon monoxide dehydrogenase subunit G n=1 Tax=Albidovulum marisflavi TaxID=2984159 RepID=A0ABT2ZFN1_9RHOB|nr:carbon monoxide dehydrogenase subunit G [Defluviimonas sp. WL0002]MCV2869581.1 carbon monoxide dehydrogenase subunit G [Defluviimonas sp. WL0002]
MELKDTRAIAALPEAVWAAILDPEVLKACIPGCESITGTPEDGFEAVVVQKVGPVKARFTGVVTLSDMVPGQSLTISGEGKGGPAGFAKGGARVRLEPDGEGTTLSYEVQAAVGGKLAQLGSRIIDGFARKLADEFFARLQGAVEAPDEDDQPEEAALDASGEGKEKKKGWFRRMTGA